MSERSEFSQLPPAARSAGQPPQGAASHGRFLLVTFLSRKRKVTIRFCKYDLFKYLPDRLYDAWRFTNPVCLRGVHFLCSPKENEPKETAPCPLALSGDPALLVPGPSRKNSLRSDSLRSYWPRACGARLRDNGKDQSDAPLLGAFDLVFTCFTIPL